MVATLLQGHCHQRDDVKFQLVFCVSSGHSQNPKKHILISFPLKSSNTGYNFGKISYYIDNLRSFRRPICITIQTMRRMKIQIYVHVGLHLYFSTKKERQTDRQCLPFEIHTNDP